MIAKALNLIAVSQNLELLFSIVVDLSASVKSTVTLSYDLLLELSLQSLLQTYHMYCR